MNKLKDLCEGWLWWFVSAAGVAALYLIAPHQPPVLLWVITQMATGGVAGYWLDRSMFPHARPGDLLGDPVEARHARYRRAALIAAGVLAAAIGY